MLSLPFFSLAYPFLAIILLVLVGFLVLTMLFFVFWISMLIECIRSGLKSGEKLLWILLIVFFNFFGALAYLLFVKMNKNYRKKTKKNDKNIKKLYRSKNNKIIAGVCGGIGEYFNIDPTLIRLLLVVLTVLGGSGLLAYIICWVIIPQER